MGQHFLLHRELVAATAVHHAVRAHLTDDAQADLVVAGPQFLRVYRLEPLPTDVPSDVVVHKGQVLHLMASFALAGTVEALHALRFDRKLLQKKSRFCGGSDVLLLTFGLYKWVIVGYDRKTHALATLAMHTFEEHAMGPGSTLKGERDGREQLLGLSTRAQARVDPQGRCGAMIVYLDQLVIVPFHSGSMDLALFEEDDDDDDDMTGGGHANGKADADEDDDEEERKLQELVNESKKRGTVMSEVDKRLKTLLDKSVKVGTKRKRNHLSGLLSNELVGREFLLRLRELDITGKIVDMAFLDGYLEPTLMLLHEENDKTSTDGRFASGYDTFCLTVISINLNTRLHPKIWTVQNLPSDCFRLIPCQAPAGGVVVLSANAVMYFNQTQFFGRATNMFAELTVNQTIFPLEAPLYEAEGESEPQKLNVLLYDCQFEYMSPKDILLTTPEGDMFVLGLPYEDSSRRSTTASSRKAQLTLKKIQTGAYSSCLSLDPKTKTLFVGSRSGDSVLYTVTERSTEAHEATETIVAQEDEPMLESADGVVDEEDADEDDLFLYGAPLKPSTLTANGKLGDEVTKITDPAPTNESGMKSFELRVIDVLPGTGQITGVELGVETNADSKEKREQLVVSGGYMQNGAISVLHNGLRPIVSTEAELSGCRAMWTVSSSLPSAKTSSDGRAYNSYLILSVAQRTMVLRTGEGMEPLEEDSGFYTSGPTLAAANLFGRQRIVQVFKQGARVMAEVPAEESAGDGENAAERAGGDAKDDEEDEEDDLPKVNLMCTQEITLEGDVECGGMDVDTSSVGIVSVDVMDPYILVLLTDGTIRVLVGDDELELNVLVPKISRVDDDSKDLSQGITSACLFYDWAGMFRDDAWGEGDIENADAGRSDVKMEDADENPASDDDEEMESLYSTKANRKPSINGTTSLNGTAKQTGATATVKLLKQTEAAMMCGVCFDDGSLHVYSLPDFKKKGIFPYLTFAPQLLVNTLEHYEDDSKERKVTFAAPILGLNASSATANDGRIKKSHTINSPVADIAIHRVGPSENQRNSQYFARMVLLVFLANGDLLMYNALPKLKQIAGGATAFQFHRVSSELITRPFIPPKTKAGASHNEVGNNPEANTSAVLSKLRAGFRYPMLTRFLNVNNMSGVFFRGAHPMWLLSERGQTTLVPMSVPKTTKTQKASVPVLCFTPFHHWNCPNGFIYYHSQGFLRLCELPSTKTSTILPSSGGVILQKAELGATIHDVLYLGSHGPGGVTEALETPTYAVICSRKVAPALAEAAMYDEDAEAEKENGEEGGPANNVMAPTAEMFPDLQVNAMAHADEDVYEMRLVQTNEFGEWERRGVFRVYFERFEVVLSTKVMFLYDSALLKADVSSTSEEWNRRKRPYLVVGTGYVGPHGEDESGKGRLLVYELDYAQYVDDSGDASGKLPKLKLVFIKKHHQGAISMVQQLGPFVLAAVGSKLIVYEFKSEQLIGCAFFDAQMYITSVSVVKDFIMYGDVYKSVYFVRWKEKQRQLVLLAKDYEPLAVTSTEFNIFDKRLALLAGDMEENLHVMQFAPNDIESRGGQRLLRTSDFHVGMQVSCMFRKGVTALPGSDPSTPKGFTVNIFGTTEGAVGALVPVGERIFRRLFTLQNVMINTLPQNCALNPREFRTMKTNGERRTGRPDGWCKQKWKKGFLDSQVLYRFLQLDYVAQKEVARCIGTTPEVIIHNLLEVQRSTATFL
ncbi:TPA: hypothetical protein N0F65_011818 [Lagenidium giganteum]|uniref:Cleavage and polyadenylation specificity factor subunit 1 n=1 Tax=Lagenidium giganteum TaxID=4803 RepID=A0AAV2Z0Q7_9STRA|nr:TPA: hypothetical protein N0F65_011818 [Lagenidium giganteum]